MKKILLTLALVAAAQFTFAQEKTDDAKQPASELMTQLRLASDLARYGYETYSASALIEAARILSGVPTYELTPESFIKGEGTADGKAQKTEFSVEQLLKDARAYADGNATLLALADQVKIDNGTSRGRVGGAAVHTPTVPITIQSALLPGKRPKWPLWATVIPTWISTSTIQTAISSRKTMTIPTPAIAVGHRNGREHSQSRLRIVAVFAIIIHCTPIEPIIH